MYRGVVGGLLVSLLAGPALRAELLPLRLYTSADGLAGDSVQSLAEDPRGFLWIGTSTGVSRFDGYTFTGYGTEDGLPHPSANVLKIASDGTVWVGTSEGLAHSVRQPVAGRPLFEALKIGPDGSDRTDSDPARRDHVLALAEGPAGRIWVGTSGGLLAVDRTDRALRARRVSLGPHEETADFEVYALFAEPGGRLWAGTSRGLFERRPDGRTTRHPLWPDAEGVDPVRALALDARGVLWVAHQRGVFAARLAAASAVSESTWFERANGQGKGGPSWRRPATDREIRAFSVASLVPKGHCSGGIAIGRDGTAWFSTSGGLIALSEGRSRLVSIENGFPERSLEALLTDRNGNLWIGAEARGLLRLSAGGFVSFGPADGLGNLRIANVFEDRAGEVVIVASDSSRRLYLFSDGRFEDVTPQAFLRLAKPGWGWNQTILQDRRGAWWFPSAEGLLRFPSTGARGLKAARPAQVYTSRDGLPSDEIFRLYEDRRGDLWLSMLNTPRTLVRFDRDTERFEVFPPFAPPFDSAPTAFAEDAAGNLWIGYYLGGLVRMLERVRVRRL